MDNNDNGCGVGDALNSPEVGENLQSSDQQFPEIEILEGDYLFLFLRIFFFWEFVRKFGNFSVNFETLIV